MIYQKSLPFFNFFQVFFDRFWRFIFKGKTTFLPSNCIRIDCFLTLLVQVPYNISNNRELLCFSVCSLSSQPLFFPCDIPIHPPLKRRYPLEPPSDPLQYLPLQIGRYSLNTLKQISYTGYFLFIHPFCRRDTSTCPPSASRDHRSTPVVFIITIVMEAESLFQYGLIDSIPITLAKVAWGYTLLFPGKQFFPFRLQKVMNQNSAYLLMQSILLPSRHMHPLLQVIIIFPALIYLTYKTAHLTPQNLTRSVHPIHKAHCWKNCFIHTTASKTVSA